MAYTIDGEGPYPNLAGEYCGNHNPNSPNLPPPSLSGETPVQARDRENQWLSQMRFGRPRPCDAEYVTAENRWVGLYLIADRPLLSFETAVPTPPELLEPPSGRKGET